jgi:hypothetical protein
LIIAPFPLCYRKDRVTFLRQVFWLPRPFSGLPIPIIRDSDTQRLKGFSFQQWQKEQGYSGGTAPEFNGIPY